MRRSLRQIHKLSSHIGSRPRRKIPIDSRAAFRTATSLALFQHWVQHMPVDSHYRWNVNPTWEHYCGMVRELSGVRDARSEVHAQHHVRAALYFGIGSVEAFLNEQMRAKMSSDGSPEEEIFTALRRTGWVDKLKKWPSALSGGTLPASAVDAVKDLSGLRGEVTHPKAKDHSIYLKLDRLLLTPEEMRLHIAEYIVRVLSSIGKPYPFYLHGRVFVGMGGDWNRPIVDTHNQQFMFALADLGFRVPAGPIAQMDAWERACMSSWEGFLQGEAALANAPCQRLNPIFPQAPRLCRRWWDSAHVQTCGDRPHAQSEHELPPTFKFELQR